MIGALSRFWKREMADILTDYREWRSPQDQRIGTHSDRCHLWHERCFVHRLAAELERTRAALVAVATQDGTLSVSEGRLFVAVDGVEEVAFDFATLRPHRTPGECSEPLKLSENDNLG
jgi:hypothetical protein